MTRPTVTTHTIAPSNRFLVAAVPIVAALVLSHSSVRLLAQRGDTSTTPQLRYDQPAELFEETLLLGNGRVGASLFGGVDTERFYLNDATLWAGGPVDARMNPTAVNHLPAVRAALAAED